MKLWHLLRGKTQDHTQTDDPMECPSCHTHVEFPRETLVEWDACHARFAILHRTRCIPCQHTLPVFAKMIPLVVTPRAVCSCGAVLALNGYAVQETQDECAVEATYSCSACKRQKRVAVGKLKRLLTKRWPAMTHLRLGPTGLQTLEAGPEEEPYMSNLATTFVGTGARV